MRRRQEAHIIFRLLARIHHQHVPGAPGAAAAARGSGHAGQRRRIRRIDQLLVAGKTALLGLENEAVALVEVDALVGSTAVTTVFAHGALEDIIVAFRRRRGRIGMRQSEEIAEFGEEQRVVRPLLPAFLPLPARDERLDYLRQ